MASKLKKLTKELKKLRALGKLGKGSPERGSILKSPDFALAPTNLSLTSEYEKDEDVELSGLTDTPYCTTPKNLAAVLGSMSVILFSIPTMRNETSCNSSEFIFRHLDGRRRIL